MKTAPGRLDRAAALITALTLVSRLTGFVRVLAVTAVLGTTFLGNVYEASNTVPNVLFELFAAGALHAVLVPTFVAVRVRTGSEGMLAAAAAVLRSLTIGLLGVCAVGLVAAPFVARLLVVGVDAADVRRAAGRLGTVFLLVFLPQVVCYGAGLVGSAALQALERFAAAAAAPIVNNVVVVAAYGTFAVLRRGHVAWPAHALRPLEVAVLAGGTTLGVLAFTTVPAFAAWRVGLRPGRRGHDEALRGMGRRGAWAAGLVALTQVQTAVVLVLAGGVAGGVVAYQFAFTWYALPYALVAVPVATALYPRLAEQGVVGGGAFAGLLRRGVFVSAVGLALGAAALGALAWPITHLSTFGRVDAAGRVAVAHALVALAPGLVGYGLVYLFVRASYALGDSRSPTLVTLATTATGIAAMFVAARVVSRTERVTALAAIQSVTTTVAAVTIGLLVARRADARLAPSAGRAVIAGSAAAAVMALAVALFDVEGRVRAVWAGAVAAPIGLLVAWAVLRAGENEPLRRRLSLEAVDT